VERESTNSLVVGINLFAVVESCSERFKLPRKIRVGSGVFWIWSVFEISFAQGALPE
jgi:hypothetical protein